MATDGAIAKNEGLYWRLESVIKRLESKTTSLIGADGACYAVRKCLFQPLPSETSVDDFLLSMRILESGHTVVYEPRAWSAEDPGQTAYDEFGENVVLPLPFVFWDYTRLQQLFYKA